jgi:hypothetical protein
MNERNAAKDEKPARLVEGEDYYREGGLIVFTALYHLKRGTCCDSGCRHCPYKKSRNGED